MIIEEHNYLEHVGVKGMQWGVRKARYEKAVRNFNGLTQQIGDLQDKKRLRSTLSEKDFKRLNNKDTVIKRGSKITRTSNNPTSSGSLFVSTNNQDANNYRAVIPVSEKGGRVQKQSRGYYETTFNATENLKSPSERKRVEGYISLMGERSIRLNTGETITGRDYLIRQGLSETVKKLNNRQLALTYYGQIVMQQGIRNEPLNTAYYNKMKTKGYNALIDDNDRGVLASTPMLVFNSSQSLKTVSVKKLTTEEVHDAQGSMKLPR